MDKDENEKNDKDNKVSNYIVVTRCVAKQVTHFSHKFHKARPSFRGGWGTRRSVLL